MASNLKKTVNIFLQNIRNPYIYTLVASVILLIYFKLFIPIDMDEFSFYSPIIYGYYPLNKLNIFREAYRAYDLALWGNVFLPLRSYHYIGVFSSIVYFPLFVIWKSPLSARFLGILAIFIQSVIISRIFNISKFKIFFILISFMPYAFIHILDTGPVKWHTTLVFLVLFLSLKLKDKVSVGSTASYFFSFLIGIIIFIGIWEKLSFFFILPCVAILILYFLFSCHRIVIKRNIKLLLMNILLISASSAIPSAILLNAKTKSLDAYRTYLELSRFINPLNFGRFWNNFYKKLLQFILNPVSSGHRVFSIPEPPYSLAGIVIMSIIITIIILGIRAYIKRKKYLSPPIVLLSLFIIGILAVSSSSKSDSMHHIVLCFPFLILAFFYALKKIKTGRALTFLLAAAALFNYWSYWNITRLNIEDHAHMSKERICTELNRKFADDHIIVVVDWGMYYLKALYGPKNQSVVYIHPLNDDETFDRLTNIATNNDRKLIFISKAESNSDLNLIFRKAPTIHRLYMGFETGPWRIWRQY